MNSKMFKNPPSVTYRNSVITFPNKHEPENRYEWQAKYDYTQNDFEPANGLDKGYIRRKADGCKVVYQHIFFNESSESSVADQEKANRQAANEVEHSYVVF